MIKLSVNETKWSSLLARTHAFILYISISIFDFGPEKLPGLSRNGPLALLGRRVRLGEEEKGRDARRLSKVEKLQIRSH